MKWIDIENHPNYQINELGQVKKKSSNKILIPFITTNGYLRIRFDGKAYQVHKLIALHFIPNTNDYQEINHIDNDKLNNNIDNLEWCTREHNMQHCVKSGRSNILDICGIKGVKNPNSKLSNEQVLEIKNRLQQGESTTSICKDYNVSSTVILNIRKGKSYTS